MRRLNGYHVRWDAPATAGGTPALHKAGAAIHFFDGISELLDRPVDLLGSDDCRGRDQQMVAGDSVHTSLYGIDQQAALQGGGGYRPAKFNSGAKGVLVCLSDTNSTPRSNPMPRTSPTVFRSQQSGERTLELGGDAAVAA